METNEWWQHGYRAGAYGIVSPAGDPGDSAAFDAYQSGYEAGCRALERGDV